MRAISCCGLRPMPPTRACPRVHSAKRRKIVRHSPTHCQRFSPNCQTDLFLFCKFFFHFLAFFSSSRGDYFSRDLPFFLAIPSFFRFFPPSPRFLSLFCPFCKIFARLCRNVSLFHQTPPSSAPPHVNRLLAPTFLLPRRRWLCQRARGWGYRLSPIRPNGALWQAIRAPGAAMCSTRCAHTPRFFDCELFRERG